MLRSFRAITRPVTHDILRDPRAVRLAALAVALAALLAACGQGGGGGGLPGY